MPSGMYMMNPSFPGVCLGDLTYPIRQALRELPPTQKHGTSTPAVLGMWTIRDDSALKGQTDHECWEGTGGVGQVAISPWPARTWAPQRATRGI